MEDESKNTLDPSPIEELPSSIPASEFARLAAESVQSNRRTSLLLKQEQKEPTDTELPPAA